MECHQLVNGVIEVRALLDWAMEYGVILIHSYPLQQYAKSERDSRTNSSDQSDACLEDTVGASSVE